MAAWKYLVTKIPFNVFNYFVVDVIWRLPVWNVKIRHYLASCTLQFWSNLTQISFQGRHFNYFLCIVVNMTCRISHFQDGGSFQTGSLHMTSCCLCAKFDNNISRNCFSLQSCVYSP
jgi:hypothetical protein